MNTLKNKISLNLIFGLVGLGINLGISFLLSPYIVRNLGVEANGFISLANNFVSYMSLFVIALNSMSNRAITLEIMNDNYDNANSYYSSVGLSNGILSFIIFIITIPFIYNLEKIIEIPSDLNLDVKYLFFFIFLTFIVNTLFSIWNVSTFISNRVYIQSIRNAQSQLIKAGLIFILFYCLNGKVSFIGIATFISTLYAIVYSFYYKKKLTPYLKVKIFNFDIKKVVELLSSGIWNTISQTGILLLSGIDLLIANVLLGPTAMGIISLSKILPAILAQLSGTISSVFVPQLTIIYAKESKEVLIKNIIKYIGVSSVILNIPLVVLLLHGEQFYKLWLPTEDAHLLYVLSILSIISILVSSGTDILPNVFLILNKLKTNALVIVFSGVVSSLICYFMVKYTNYGIYAIAGTSSVINLITKLLYTLPFSAIELKTKWTTFFPLLLRSLISISISLLLGGRINSLIILDGNWIELIFRMVITGMIAFTINVIIYKKIVFERK